MTRVKVFLYGSLFDTLPISISYDSKDMIACNLYISGRATLGSRRRTLSALYFRSSRPILYHNQLEPPPSRSHLLEHHHFSTRQSHAQCSLYLSYDRLLYDIVAFGSIFSLEEVIFFLRHNSSRPARFLSLDASRQSGYLQSTLWHSGPTVLRGGQPIFIHF